MKEEILNHIKMIDIVDKYGISHKNLKISCPFHGEDKHPSAKIYEYNFHCFTCSKHLDVIGFVEEYFNLSFKDAMQKINIDFNMGLDSNYVDYEKLRELKAIQNEKKERKQRLVKKYCYMCDVKHYYEKLIIYFTKKTNIKNWEITTHTIAYFQDEIEKINEELEDIEDLISSRT